MTCDHMAELTELRRRLEEALAEIRKLEHYVHCPSLAQVESGLRVKLLEDALRPFAVSGWDMCSDNEDGEIFLGADAVSLGHVATARRLLGMEVEP